MNSFFQWRIGKAKDQVAELENEVKLSHSRTKFILEKGLTLVKKISSSDDLNSAKEYTSVSQYLSKYTKVLSEFNCNLEMLLFTDGLMNELNEINTPEHLSEKEILDKNKVDYPNHEKQSNEWKESKEDIIFPSSKYVSFKEKRNESTASVAQNELSEENKSLGHIKKSGERKKESTKVDTEISVSCEAAKTSNQKNQNSTVECPNNNKKNISMLGGTGSNGQTTQRANNSHNCTSNVNSLAPAVKSESKMTSGQCGNSSVNNCFAPHENNYLYWYASNGFPAENSYRPMSQEGGKEFQNFPYNSRPMNPFQAEPHNFNRPNRQNFYPPPFQSQHNFSAWNNIHCSNFPMWNSLSNQMPPNPSFQYFFPFYSNLHPLLNPRNDFLDSNSRWPVPRNVFNPIQVGQHQLGFTNFDFPVKANEFHYLSQASKGKNTKTNSSSRNNGDTDENQTKHPKQEKHSMGRECNLKSNHGIRLLNFNREIGMKYNANISYLNSPNEFYVHVKCEEIVLMNDMNKKLKNLENIKEKAESRATSGSYYSRKVEFLQDFGCYALGFCAENSSWKRLKVLDWRLGDEDEMVRVFLIDYGNSIDLPLSMLQPMHSTYMSYPQFSQKCHLTGIFNKETNPDFVSPWFEESKVLFEILIESMEKNFDLTIEILEREGSGEGASLGVRLNINELKICVNEKLKNLKTNFVISNLIDKPQISIPDEESSDSESSVDFDNFLPQFSIGEKISVKITCILRVNRFFCVRNYEEEYEQDILKDLVYSLNSEKNESLDAPPNVGELILGKYTDFLYYRAKVVKSHPNSDMFKVLFLDYGNTEKISWKDMKKIEKKHLKVPFQMIECHLDCIELNSDTDEPLEAINYFTKKLGGDPVTIKIKRILDGKRAVYGVDVYDRQGNNIACDLVSEEYCVFFRRNY